MNLEKVLKKLAEDPDSKASAEKTFKVLKEAELRDSDALAAYVDSKHPEPPKERKAGEGKRG